MRESKGLPGLAFQALVLGLVILLVYGLLFWSPLLYDDSEYILQDPDIFGAWRGLRESLTMIHGEYAPLTTWVHRLLYRIAGEDPGLYRVTSLALHWINTLLTLFLYRRFMGARTAFLCALLFALYPPQSEVLAFSTFNKHQLVFLFGLCLLHGLRPGLPAPGVLGAGVPPPSRTGRGLPAPGVPGAGVPPPSRTGRGLPGPWRALACWSAMALGLCAKESAVTLPALGLLMDLAEGPGWRERWRANRPIYAGLAVMAAAFAVWRALELPPQPLAALQGASWAAHLLTSAKGLLWYLAHLLAPLNLCLECTVRPAAWPSWEALAIPAGIGLMALALARLWRRDRVAAAGCAWALLALGPFLNIIPYLDMSLVSNRYLYLPSAGFFLALGRLWNSFYASRRRAPAFAEILSLGVALLYASLIMRELGPHSDPIAFWTKTADCAPAHHPRPRIALAELYRRRGRYAEAEAQLRLVLDNRPPGDYGSFARLHLAFVYADSGRLKEAIGIARAEAETTPSLEAHEILGECLLRAGRWQEACSALERAERLGPESAGVLTRMGYCRLRLGRLAEAEEIWLKATRVPTHSRAAWAFLGRLYESQRRLDLAREAFAKAGIGP